jgi:predicted AAA+ superfamily ATPase
MVSRLIKDTLLSSPKSILLIGPRQVGKSSLIQSLNPDLSINLSNEKTFIDFKSNPGELEERLKAHKYKTVFIDEIQKHPPLLDTIQTIIDAQPVKQRTKFYLTGSSARKLKRGQANLLPGRIFSYEMGPLCAAELDYDLNISRALCYGCLPEAYLTKQDDFSEKLLSTYSGVYLKEEIQAEALTRNLDGFSRFILAAAENSGQVLDFSKLAKQARIERKNCVRFYEILEDTLIAYRLEVFDKTTADIKRRPKFFFFDTGVLNGLLENFTVSNDRKGTLLETLVVSQLLASAKARDQKINLTYFRTRAGYEVDLIVELNRKIYAVEIKSGQITSSDTKKIEAITNYGIKFDGLFALGMDPKLRQLGQVRVCDLNQFLKEIGL